MSEIVSNLSKIIISRYIVTCGSEGDVRIWKGFEDEEPVDKCVGDKAYAVVVKVIIYTLYVNTFIWILYTLLMTNYLIWLCLGKCHVSYRTSNIKRRPT